MEKQQIQKHYAAVREVMDRVSAAIDALNAAAERLNTELSGYAACREEVVAFTDYMSTGQWKEELSPEEGERYCTLLGEIAELEAQLRPQGHHCCHGHHDGDGEHHCCHGHHEGEGEHHCCHGHHEGEGEHHCCHGHHEGDGEHHCCHGHHEGEGEA